MIFLNDTFDVFNGLTLEWPIETALEEANTEFTAQPLELSAIQVYLAHQLKIGEPVDLSLSEEFHACSKVLLMVGPTAQV